MVCMSVKTASGEWKLGIALEYEEQPLDFNQIILSHCGDYHSRVTGFFAGYGADGKVHFMAAFEEFPARDLKSYLAAHNLPMPCGHRQPCSCARVGVRA